LHRFAIFPLLGPALVFYLIADVSSSQGRLDPYGYVIAAVAIGLSFARRNGAANGESRAVQLVGWLGLSAGVALLRLLSEQTLRLSVDMAEAMALSLLGALLIDLALCVPDPLASLRIRGSILAGVYLCAALSGVLSCVALGPQFHMFGEVWLIPARYVNSSAVFSGLSVFAALGLRAARKRLGSSQEALVANVWGLIGVLPAALLCSLILLGPELLPAQFVRIWAALSALVLYVGHLCLIDTRRRLSVSRATRDGIAACASVVIVATFAGLFSAGIPSDALPRGLWVATSLLFALALYHLLRPSVRRALAPAGGQLLEALSSTQPELGRAHTLEGLVAISLAGVRAASGVTWAKPLMYGFDPGFEAFIDAAGAPHLSTRQPHPMLLARLRERPGDLVLRADLEMQMVRQPSIRPLLEALLEQDVLCVLPLVVESELEGALLLPRGERRAALSVEEQDALWEFARHLAGLLAVFSAKARAEQRANSASLGNSRAQAEIAVLSDVVHSLQADLEVLQVGRSLQAEAATLVAYSAPQRQLLAQLKALAKQSQQHVLCVAEAGVAVEPLARFVHGKAEHAAAPFVMLDCAAVRAEHAEAAIFGGLGPLGPEVGALRVAAAGTLLLLDLAALPLDVQHKLAGALASRKAQLQGSEEAYAVQARVIASVREDVFLLSSQGRFAAELADQLAPGTCRIPPLRECGEDVSSLALLAIDRACRRHGRGPVGIETEALAELRRYAFPGNHWELERIIDGAVTQATGIRLSVADLALSHGPKPNEDVLHATLEEIERRALVHALLRAAGNKSEAARLLAIPRTTLLDKLRRHKLDEAPQETPRAN
jgi:two-component system response regulator HydG